MNKSKVYRARRRKRPRKLSHLAAKVLSTVCAVAIFAGLLFAFSNAFGETPQRLSDGIAVDCLTRVELPDDVNEEMIDYTGFRVSFNSAHHLPNYSAWELTGEETKGNVPRESNFKPDKNVYGCATLDDYRRSGYDRGHMAPAGDMKWSAEAMADSHYLTNICPQDHSINGGRWSTLEKKCRQWAERDSSLIIICGPILTDQLDKAIGAQQVSVPERFFKVVFAPYTIPPRAIAFIFPNHPTTDGLESMVTSVDAVEAITGFDFFQCLPDDIEEEVEKMANYRVWERKNR